MKVDILNTCLNKNIVINNKKVLKLFSKNQPRPIISNKRYLVKVSVIDSAPEWTLDQIVGLAFGGLMLSLYFGSSFIDNYIAREQRISLGICEECGGLYDSITCNKKECPEKSHD